jgi:hypothetical protein
MTIEIPKFLRDQVPAMERINADAEAFAAMVSMFKEVHGRKPVHDLEAFAWGAKNTDENLRAFGFADRAGFQYCFDCVLAVSGEPDARQ